ncbi:MAG: DMT family transporter [Rhodobacteraceae bacterium]|jgi:drug/metabolite transporter (DMT)-like permease|nr:DMT family transporter [Paracoccaceae bacterium]MEC7253282.1 DMT family transporter [Pseudomonadota bacterium]|tara:strand:+ start:4577 stop:5494 length:918 start_codon:yes stop_codon:yes gene_type:complete
MKSQILSRAYSSAPFLLFLATLGWGSNTIASRLAVGEVSPMLLIFFRWGFVVVILLSLYWRQMIDEWPIIRPRLKWLLIMGGCGLSLFNAFFYIAAHSTTAVNLGIIQSTMPGMILLGSFMFFGDRINRLQFSGLLLTLLGVGVIVTQGSLEQLMQLTFNHGDLLMIFACSFYAMYTVGLKSRPKISGMVMLAYFSVAAFLMTIPLMIFESFIYGTVMPGVKGFAIVFYIAMVPSFLSQIFFMRGVDLIGPGSAGLYANLVPIFSAIMAVLLLSEEFALFHLAAMLLVFGGIGLFEYQSRRKVSS